MKSLVLYDDKYEKTSEIFISEVFLEAQTGFEPVNQGVADPRLTTWLLRLIHIYTTHSKIICIVLSFFSQQYFCCPNDK